MEDVIRIKDGEEINVIVGKKVKKDSQQILDSWVVQKVVPHLDDSGKLTIDIIGEHYFIKAEEMIHLLNKGELYFVMSDDGIDALQNYQVLSYDVLDGFTSDGDNYHY